MAKIQSQRLKDRDIKAMTANTVANQTVFHFHFKVEQGFPPLSTIAIPMEVEECRRWSSCYHKSFLIIGQKSDAHL